MGKNDKVEAALKVDKTGVEAKLSLPTALAWVVSPERTAKAAALKALTDDIPEKLARGESLLPIQQELLLMAVADQARKTKNLDETLGRFRRNAPDVAGMFEAPKAVPQLPGKVGGDEEPAKEFEPSDTVMHWFEQWRASAQEASVEYVQELYAKLLEGQLRSPGSLSLRTLDVVRSLDERGAKLFHKYRGFVLGELGFPYWSSHADWAENGLNFYEVLELADYGLCVESPKRIALDPDGTFDFGYHNRKIRVRGATLLHYPLTRAGRELLALLDSDDSRWPQLAIWLSREVGPFEVCSDGGRFEPWSVAL
ncbi:MAG TPA: DUF2806 domain-containing protein [Polyangiaceae bacterium]|nr:DUF2806 domain-containing protein [Polyangiaceae bacterium]